MKKISGSWPSHIWMSATEYEVYTHVCELRRLLWLVNEHIISCFPPIGSDRTSDKLRAEFLHRVVSLERNPFVLGRLVLERAKEPYWLGGAIFSVELIEALKKFGLSRIELIEEILLHDSTVRSIVFGESS